MSIVRIMPKRKTLLPALDYMIIFGGLIFENHFNK
jgi:hypothetical protein